MSRITRTTTVLFTTLLMSATIAPSTWAASAQQDGYGPLDDVTVEPTPDASDDLPAAQNAAPSATSASALPFTGLEAGLIGAAGLGLAGVGVTLRRAGRAQR